MKAHLDAEVVITKANSIAYEAWQHSIVWKKEQADLRYEFKKKLDALVMEEMEKLRILESKATKKLDSYLHGIMDICDPLEVFEEEIE